MSPKVAVGNGSSVVLVLGLDPFPRTASPSQGEGESSGYHAERRLMNECVREAFWSRVLPLSGCLALAFRQAARMRLIASHPTIGVPLRYWALGALVGFEGGCAMYGDSCANKAVVRMPNSKLVANILRSRNQLPANNFNMSRGETLEFMSMKTVTFIYKFTHTFNPATRSVGFDRPFKELKNRIGKPVR